MCPKNASYYGNRAATLMMLCRYREALEDSQQAVRLDNTFMKVGGGGGKVARRIKRTDTLMSYTLPNVIGRSRVDTHTKEWIIVFSCQLFLE